VRCRDVNLKSIAIGTFPYHLGLLAKQVVGRCRDVLDGSARFLGLQRTGVQAKKVATRTETAAIRVISLFWKLAATRRDLFVALIRDWISCSCLRLAAIHFPHISQYLRGPSAAQRAVRT
jgi:hypothetical protein